MVRLFRTLWSVCSQFPSTPNKSISTNSTRSLLTRTMSSASSIPATSAYVAPGNCQFTDTPTPAKLVDRQAVGTTSGVLRFALPDATKPLGLSTCACLLAVAEINGETVVRPYTPISTNALTGCFDLMVKNYGEHAKMSHHLHTLPVNQDDGSSNVSFKHIQFNVKIQKPNFRKAPHILMLVGGTGIAPMIQALHELLGDKECSSTKVTVLYGSKVADDILAKQLLDQWTADHADQLTVVHVLSDEPADSEWKGPRGYMTKDMIHEYLTSDSMVWVCGPPPMYKALCGPRDEPAVSGILKEMGCTDEQVYKF